VQTEDRHGPSDPRPNRPVGNQFRRDFARNDRPMIAQLVQIVSLWPEGNRGPGTCGLPASTRRRVLPILPFMQVNLSRYGFGSRFTTSVARIKAGQRVARPPRSIAK